MSNHDSKLETPKKTSNPTQPAQRLSDILSFAASSHTSSSFFYGAPLEREERKASPRGHDGNVPARSPTSVSAKLLPRHTVDGGDNNLAFCGHSNAESSASARPLNDQTPIKMAPQGNDGYDPKSALEDDILVSASSGPRNSWRTHGASALSPHAVLTDATGAANDLISNVDSPEFIEMPHSTSSSRIAAVFTTSTARDFTSNVNLTEFAEMSHGTASSPLAPVGATRQANDFSLNLNSPTCLQAQHNESSPRIATVNTFQGANAAKSTPVSSAHVRVSQSSKSSFMTAASVATDTTPASAGTIKFLYDSSPSAIPSPPMQAETTNFTHTESNTALSRLTAASRDSTTSTIFSSADVADGTITHSVDRHSNAASLSHLSILSWNRPSTMTLPSGTDAANDAKSIPALPECSGTSYGNAASPTGAACSRNNLHDANSKPAVLGFAEALQTTTSKVSGSSSNRSETHTKAVDVANSSHTSLEFLSFFHESSEHTATPSPSAAEARTSAGHDTLLNPASPHFMGAPDGTSSLHRKVVDPHDSAKTVEETESNPGSALSLHKLSHTKGNGSNPDSNSRKRQKSGCTKNASKVNSPEIANPQPRRSSASAKTSNLSDATFMRRWAKNNQESQFRPTLTESFDLHLPESARDLLEKYEPLPRSARLNHRNTRQNTPNVPVVGLSLLRIGSEERISPSSRARTVPPLSGFSSEKRDVGTSTPPQLNSYISRSARRARSFSSRSEPRVRSFSLRDELLGRSLSSRPVPQASHAPHTGDPRPRSPLRRPRLPLLGSNASVHYRQWTPARSWEPPLRCRSTFLPLDCSYPWSNAVHSGWSTPSGPLALSSRVGSIPASGRRHGRHECQVFGSAPWRSPPLYGSSVPLPADIGGERRRSDKRHHDSMKQTLISARLFLSPDDAETLDTPVSVVRRCIASAAEEDGENDAINAREDAVAGFAAQQSVSGKLSEADRILTGRIPTLRDDPVRGFPDTEDVLCGSGAADSKKHAHGGLSKARNDIDEALQVNEDTMRKILQLEFTMKQNHAEWKQKERDFRQHVDGLKKQLEHAEGCISTLRHSNQELTERAEDAEQFARELEANQGSMERDIARLKQELHDATLQECTVQELQEQLATVHERSVVAQRDVERRARMAEDEAREWQHKADTSDWELSQANNAIELMQHECRELHTECGQASTVAAQKYALEENVAEIRNEFREMKREVQAERAHLGSVQRELEDTQRNYHRSEQEAAKHAHACDEAKRSVQYLESEVQQSAEQCSYQEVEIQRLTDQLAQLRTQCNENMRHARSNHTGLPHPPPKHGGFHVDVNGTTHHRSASLSDPLMRCPPPVSSMDAHLSPDADLHSPHRGINGLQRSRVHLYVSPQDQSESPPACAARFARAAPMAEDIGVRNVPRTNMGPGRREDWDDSPPSRYPSPTPSTRRPTTLGPFGQFTKQARQERPICRGRSRAPYAEHYGSTPNASARSRGTQAVNQLVHQLAQGTGHQSTEQQLTALNKERELLHAALMKLPENSNGRTIQERQKKTECETRLRDVERQIAQLRTVLKNIKLRKPYRA